MSFQTYQDSKKVLIEDPPYYGIIAAAKLVADADSSGKIELAWGHELRSPGRAFDLKAGIWLVDNFPTYTLETYMFAAIVASDTSNMELIEEYFPAMLRERRARYMAPGGRLPNDPPIKEEE